MNPCPQCGRAMLVNPIGGDISHPWRQSRDHILPRERGGTRFIHGRTRNIRLMCQECNGLLAACLHCVGAVACARDVAQARGTKVGTVLNQWGMGQRAEIARSRQKRTEVDHTLSRLRRALPSATIGDLFREKSA